MKSSEIGLGDCLFDVETGRLTGPDGEEITLRHQTREVLARLACTPTSTVSRADFERDVWEGAQVGEDSLVQCIAEIRRAIGDTDRRIVVTTPRKGYRLMPTHRPSRRPTLREAAAAFALLAIVAGLVLYSRSAPAPSIPPRVIAVLPFADDSTGADTGRLGDLIAEGVLDRLARYPELTVIARSSSFRFRGGATDVREIGAALGADLVLEGSQQLDGEALIVALRLIDTDSNAPVWSDRIDSDLGRLIDVRDDIAHRVAHRIERRVREIATSGAGPRQVDALLLSQEARRFTETGPTPENIAAALAIDERNADLYPEAPWGHIGIAFAKRLQVRFGWVDTPGEVLSEAERHAETAAALAPESYLPHWALGRVRMQAGDHLRAVEAFETALALNPSAADVYGALAQAHFYLGQDDAAREALDRATVIDPLPNLLTHWIRAWSDWQSGSCPSARAAFARIPRVPPGAPSPTSWRRRRTGPSRRSARSTTASGSPRAVSSAG